LIWRIFCFVLACAFAAPAEARVFNYKDSGLAAYIRGTGGLSAVAKKPFAKSSGTDTSVDGESKYVYSGEIGGMFRFGGNANLRIGAELIQHRPVKEASGTSAAGNERFTMDSSVFVFNPNITLEYVYSGAGNLRYYAAFGVGLADVTVENRYTMTTQGTTDLGVGSFNEKMAASTTSGHFMIGLETLFVDNATFSLDVGYRHLPVKSMKYKGDVANIVGGGTKGADALNHDGSKRSMDLGGLMVGVGFRFYMNFL